MTDLDRLIEAVEGGNVRPYVIEELASLVFDFRVYGDIARAYHGSLDAAKALQDALLPGWDMQRGEWIGDASVCLIPPRGYDKGYVEVDCLTLGDLARAWLLAILKAYRIVNA